MFLTQRAYHEEPKGPLICYDYIGPKWRQVVDRLRNTKLVHIQVWVQQYFQNKSVSLNSNEKFLLKNFFDF